MIVTVILQMVMPIISYSFVDAIDADHDHKHDSNVAGAALGAGAAPLLFRVLRLFFPLLLRFLFVLFEQKTGG